MYHKPCSCAQICPGLCRSCGCLSPSRTSALVVWGNGIGTVVKKNYSFTQQLSGWIRSFTSVRTALKKKDPMERPNPSPVVAADGRNYYGDANGLEALRRGGCIDTTSIGGLWSCPAAAKAKECGD